MVNDGRCVIRKTVGRSLCKATCVWYLWNLILISILPWPPHGFIDNGCGVGWGRGSRCVYDHVIVERGGRFRKELRVLVVLGCRGSRRTRTHRTRRIGHGRGGVVLSGCGHGIGVARSMCGTGVVLVTNVFCAHMLHMLNGQF